MCSATSSASKKIASKAGHFDLTNSIRMKNSSLLVPKLTSLDYTWGNRDYFSTLLARLGVSWSHPFSCWLFQKHPLYCHQLYVSKWLFSSVTWVPFVFFRTLLQPSSHLDSTKVRMVNLLGMFGLQLRPQYFPADKPNKLVSNPKYICHYKLTICGCSIPSYLFSSVLPFACTDEISSGVTQTRRMRLNRNNGLWGRRCRSHH